jgi:hypothetical protein
LADPLVITSFSLCSLLIVTVMGLVWDRIFPGTAAPEPDPPRVAVGAKRMLSVAEFAARDLAGPSTLYIFMGLIGVALLSMMLPPGALQTAAEADDPWAPLFMTLVAIPAYATPMTAMVQLASMFQHGNSVGAAFALLVLGAGANVGLACWMARHYGVRRTLVWFVLLLAVVVGLAYGVDKPLRPQGVESAGHTHAFDIYCAPFESDVAEPWTLAARQIQEKLAPHEMVALLAVGLIAVAGIGLRFADPRRRLEEWFARESSKPTKYDIRLPGAVLGGVAIAGLVALSVFGCYVYYPPPSEIFEELRMVNAEVVSAASSRDWDTALYWIPIYDDWTRKLQVSAVLRGEKLTDYRRIKASILRDKLELLEHEVEDGEVEESREASLAVGRAYRRMRAAYGR